MTSGSVNSLLAKANRLVKKKDFSEAEKIYSSILSKYPSNQEAKKALHDLTTIQDKKSNVPIELIQTISNYYSQGNLREAFEMIDKAHSEYKNNYLLLNLKGAIYSKNGDNQNALESFEKSIQLEPYEGETHNARGFALFRLNLFDEAKLAFKRALDLNPKNSAAYNNLGVLFLECNRLEDAEMSFQCAIQQKNDYYEAYINLGNVLQKMEKIPEAMNCYKKAVTINPNHFEGHVNLGNTLKGLGQNQQAIDFYKMALALNPQAKHVQHLLDSLTGKTTEVAPKEYVAKVFDEYAPRFERHLTIDLQYNTPTKLRNMFDNFAEIFPDKAKNAVDLGCGTGLCGIAFNGVYEKICGIDLSSKMLEEAKKKNIYDKLILGDLIDSLDTHAYKFDLFISADTFIYLGNLSRVFESAAKRAAPNAGFIFTTESCETEPYILGKSGRYSHSFPYIESVCKKNGFMILKYLQDTLRKEPEGWVLGGFYLAKRV